MKNVTITLDKEVARRARIRAAEQETSLSRMLGEMLRQKMEAEKVYGTAMQHYLAQPARLLKKSNAKYPRRDTLHDR